MKANPARVKLTYDDFLLFPDDGKRHELIEGDARDAVAEHEAPGDLGNLYFMIRSWLEQHPVGRIF